MGASLAGFSAFEDKILPALNELPVPDRVVDFKFTEEGIGTPLRTGELSLSGMTVHWVQGVDGEPLPDLLVPERLRAGRQHEILRANEGWLKHILPERFFVPEYERRFDALALARLGLRTYTAYRAAETNAWRQSRGYFVKSINRRAIEDFLRNSRPGALSTQSI